MHALSLIGERLLGPCGSSCRSARHIEEIIEKPQRFERTRGDIADRQLTDFKDCFRQMLSVSSVRISPGGRLSACKLIRSATPTAMNSLSLAVF
jgi:hypothetical protein